MRAAYLICIDLNDKHVTWIHGHLLPSSRSIDGKDCMSVGSLNVEKVPTRSSSPNGCSLQRMFHFFNLIYVNSNTEIE